MQLPQIAGAPVRPTRPVTACTHRNTSTSLTRQIREREFCNSRESSRRPGTPCSWCQIQGRWAARGQGWCWDRPAVGAASLLPTSSPLSRGCALPTVPATRGCAAFAHTQDTSPRGPGPPCSSPPPAEPDIGCQFTVVAFSELLLFYDCAP